MKILRFVLNSAILFWSYFLPSLLIVMILQTPLRLIVPALSKGEYLWKTVVMYLTMAVACSVFTMLRSPLYKIRYFRSLGDNSWTFGAACRYIVRCPDFWYNAAGFAVWPALLPSLFGVIHRLYFSAEFLESAPLRLLAILTVDLPFILVNFIAWIILLRYWSKNRMHTAGNSAPDGNGDLSR